jgi:hypothetical protein
LAHSVPRSRNLPVAECDPRRIEKGRHMASTRLRKYLLPARYVEIDFKDDGCVFHAAGRKERGWTGRLRAIFSPILHACVLLASGGCTGWNKLESLTGKRVSLVFSKAVPSWQSRRSRVRSSPAPPTKQITYGFPQKLKIAPGFYWGSSWR